MMDRDWRQEDWRNNPQIRRSSNPELKRLAKRAYQYYASRGDSLEYITRINCGFMGRHSTHQENVINGYKYEVTTGAWLIPGEDGVRCSSRQAGVLVEYDDGRVEWNVFSLPELYAELLHPKPVQLELGLSTTPG